MEILTNNYIWILVNLLHHIHIIHKDQGAIDATLSTVMGVLVSGDPALPGYELNWDTVTL